MTRPAINTGKVDWSGENPGMYLKEQEDGPFTGLVSFFRVVASPHGPGHAVIVLTDPANPTQGEGSRNAVYTDNPALARYLINDFGRYFGAFKPVQGLTDLPIKGARNFQRSGDAASSYTESADTDDGQMTLTWSQLEEPFMVEYMPAQSATGRHEMFSLFVTARACEARIGDVSVKGRPFPRDMAGKNSSTAFLAFSETWVTPQGG
jgi:hypothetical protein